jgi:hypothetical protein
VSVGLVRQNKLGVTLSCIARTCVTAIHPVHEVAITVPDGENEDHATLKSFAHDFQSAKSLGLSRSGVAVILQTVSRYRMMTGEEEHIPW